MSSTVGPTNFAPDVAPGAASMKLEAPNAVALERRMLPVLVATDGREDACGAVRAAARVAVQLDGVPQLMAVLEPVPTYGARIDPAVLDAIETDRARATREAMLAQLHAEIGPDATWPAQVAFGSTARTLAEVAAERRAQLTVIGLGAHRLSDRIFGTETALQTLRMSSGPVLAVPDGADGTFRRAVDPNATCAGHDASGPISACSCASIASRVARARSVSIASSTDGSTRAPYVGTGSSTAISCGTPSSRAATRPAARTAPHAAARPSVATSTGSAGRGVAPVRGASTVVDAVPDATADASSVGLRVLDMGVPPVRDADLDAAPLAPPVGDRHGAVARSLLRRGRRRRRAKVESG